MTVVTVAATDLAPGDLYVFANGATATIRRVYRTPSDKVRVAFTDPQVRYGACAPTSQHRIGRW